MGEEFFDLHLTSLFLQTIMLFILQRLEADFQFSAFDGIFFLGFLAKRKVEDQIIGAMSQAYCRFKLILC